MKKNTVLIVDDQEINIEILNSMLEETYDVRFACNGQEALEVLDKTEVDLVFLDLMMPVMDGFEVLENIKKDQRFRNLPVIFITSETDSFSEARGLSLGAVDYIRKPYDSNIVGIKCKNHIENKMYRDDLESIVEERTKEISVSREAIIMAMSLLAEGRDQETGEHIRRMQNYTKIIANRLYKNHPELLAKEEVSYITSMAPLHDVGKINIPDVILLKPGKLTDEEFDVMKSHTTLGAEVLKETEKLMLGYENTLHYAYEITAYHHEKYDGTGYPNGLGGDEIPISAAICSLADVYDALTSERPYKKAFSHECAMEIITAGDARVMPSHFQPAVLEAFKQAENEIVKFRNSFFERQNAERAKKAAENEKAENDEVLLAHERLSLVKKMHEEEARAQVLFNAAPLSASLWDGGCNLVDCNEETLGMHELSDKQEYLDDFDDLSPKFQPDGITSAEKFRQNIKKAFGEGRLRFAYTFQTKGKTPVPCEITMVRVDYRGESHVACYARDLREG
ncbi:MAG: response regulator [Oscillospiraceae bacterium]|nr:response regulator [Oscillospiraceae bacterium]